jgi:hypothetical protein
MGSGIDSAVDLAPPRCRWRLQKTAKQDMDASETARRTAEHRPIWIGGAACAATCPGSGRGRGACTRRDVGMDSLRRHQENDRGPLRGERLNFAWLAGCMIVRAGSHAAGRVGGSDVDMLRPRGAEVVTPLRPPATTVPFRTRARERAIGKVGKQRGLGAGKGRKPGRRAFQMPPRALICRTHSSVGTTGAI